MPTPDFARKCLAALDANGLYSSVGNLLFYTRYIFDRVPLEGRAMLDIGGGTGVYTFYAAGAGARLAVCLEPEAVGATSGVRSRFTRVHDALDRPSHIRMEGLPLAEFRPGDERFDVILLNNSINHLDEEACIRLPHDEGARRRYEGLFARLYDIAAPGADLVLTDCSNRNLFPMLSLRNPMLPTIEWQKHQPPETWAELLSGVGFVNPRIRWTSFNRLRTPGRVLFGNRIASFVLMSAFCLNMKRP